MTLNLLRSVSFLTSLLMAVALSFSAQAVEIREVTSKTGIKAYLVEDYTLPIISASFSFKGGSLQDPGDKAGLARLMTSLFDEGAGEFDASTYRKRLEELGIELGFSPGRETIRGGLRTVKSESAAAFEMLRLALVEPSFDEDAIERMRDAIRLGIMRSKNNPGSVGSLVLGETLFGKHPYGRATSGDETTIEQITRDDIVAAHKRLIARDNLYIGVVGAISETELVQMLDNVFGELPENAQLQDIAEISPQLGQETSVEMPVPNASIRLVYSGLKRSDPDFFAAHLMNHILGGGTFSSRLYEQVREKRGLAYGVSSGISTFDQTAYLAIGTSTRADNQEQAIAVIREEIRKLVENGVTEEELDLAKRYVKGSYAINNLDTSAKIARVLVALQSEKLGIDYINQRGAIIDAVTLDDVNAMAKRLLSEAPTVVVVGPAEQTQ